MFRIIKAVAFLYFFCCCALPAVAEELVFVNDATPYCPYTICNNGRGYVIDVLIAVYEQVGYTVKIENLPWNRAIAMVGTGKVNGIVGITRDVLPQLVYPKSEIARYTPAVFSLKANPWDYDGVASLKAIRLGMVENYGNGEGNPELAGYLDSRPANVTYIAADNAISHLFMMIEAGHIDAMIEDQAVGNYHLQIAGKAALFKATPIQKHSLYGYIGFDPNDKQSRHLAAQFDAGLDRLRKTGRLKAILARYSLSDWVK